MARKSKTTKQITAIQEPPVTDPKRAEYVPEEAKDKDRRRTMRGQNANDREPGKDHVYGVASRDRWPDNSDADTRLASQNEGSDADDTDTVEPDKMTVAELKGALDEAGVEYAADAKKADLVAAYSDYLADNQ